MRDHDDRGRPGTIVIRLDQPAMGGPHAERPEELTHLGQVIVGCAQSVGKSICTLPSRLSRSPLNFGGGLHDRQAAITGSS